MGTALTEFMGYLTGGIKDIAEGVGAGVQSLVTEMFLVTNTSGEVTGLSAFGGVIGIFAGISLAVGLSTLIFNLLRRQG